MLHAGEADAEGADKIAPFINALIINFNNAFYPGICISMDEMVIGWTGIWLYKQFNPSKPAKYHIKAFGLCDSVTGYVINLLVYFGSNTDYRSTDDPKSGNAKKVFHTFLEPLGTGHHVFADRFYTSYELVDFLLKRRTHYTGTLDLRRKDFPPELKTLKLEMGERQDFLNEKKTILCTAFRDKKAKKHFVVVSTKSTYANVSVKNKRSTKIKPSNVNSYNHNMNGCDRVDQMVSYYSAYQRKTHKWWKKLFHWSLEITQNNAYVLYCMSKPGLKNSSLLSFKLELIQGLTKLAAATMPSDLKNLPPKSNRGRPKDVHSMERIQGSRHLIRFVNKDRNCMHCSKPTARKRSSYVCTGCTGMPHLCPKFCFEEWHKVQ